MRGGILFLLWFVCVLFVCCLFAVCLLFVVYPDPPAFKAMQSSPKRKQCEKSGNQKKKKKKPVSMKLFPIKTFQQESYSPRREGKGEGRLVGLHYFSSFFFD